MLLIFSRYSSSMKSLSNKFMHLTNYSINKKNEGAYQANSDETLCQGHKWCVIWNGVTVYLVAIIVIKRIIIMLIFMKLSINHHCHRHYHRRHYTSCSVHWLISYTDIVFLREWVMTHEQGFLGVHLLVVVSVVMKVLNCLGFS